MVAALIARELARNDDFAFVGEATAIQREETFFDALGQSRRFTGVPAELSFATHLVDVLPAWAAAARILEVKFFSGNLVGLG